MTRGGEVSVEFAAPFVAVVEVHRPPHNYLDIEVLGHLVAAIRNLEGEGSCRAVVLASEGRNFSAGADFWGVSGGVPGGPPDIGEFYRHAVALFAGHIPIVAAVQGGAVGGGLGLACVADFRVAAPESWFAAPFTHLGISPGFGLTVTLPRLVGSQHAADMVLTGRRIGGEEARRMGLSDRLVDADEVRDAAVSMAEEIAAGAPLAVQAVRRGLRGDLAEQVRHAVIHEEAEQAHLRTTADWQEGLRAVEERRPPSFRGA